MMGMRIGKTRTEEIRARAGVASKTKNEINKTETVVQCGEKDRRRYSNDIMEYMKVSRHRRIGRPKMRWAVYEKT